MRAVRNETPAPTWLIAVAAALLLVAGFAEASKLASFTTATPRTPLWDMAGHGWQGVELFRDLRGAHPIRFLLDLNRQDKWPFGYSLGLLPFYFVAGPTVEAARASSLVLFTILPLLLLAVTVEIDRSVEAVAGGLVAGVLLLFSPLDRLFAILVMRELACSALLLIALALLLRAHRVGTLGAFRVAGLATLALLLVKWNYGAIWILSAAAIELARDGTPLRRLARPLLRRPGPVATLSGGLGIVLAVLALLRVEIGGILYALLVVAAAAAVVDTIRRPGQVVAALRSLPVPLRALTETVVAPLALWSLSPSPIHPKSILHFLRNRDGAPEQSFAKASLTYVRSFLHDDVPSVGIGVAVLVLATSFLLLALRGSSDRRRALALALVCGVGAVSFHAYKEPRFLLPVVPFVFLAAGLLPATLLDRLAAPRSVALAAASLLALSAVALVLLRGEDPRAQARLAAEFESMSGPPEIAEALDFLRERAPTVGRISTVGGFNELSPNLVAWTLATRPGCERLDIVPALGRPRPAETSIDARVADWLAVQRPDYVILIEPDETSRLAQSADYRRYNAWQRDAASALVLRPGTKIEAETSIPAIGLRLRVIAPPAHGTFAAAKVRTER